jgi:hypothetical protein
VTASEMCFTRTARFTLWVCARNEIIMSELKIPYITGFTEYKQAEQNMFTM